MSWWWYVQVAQWSTLGDHFPRIWQHMQKQRKVLPEVFPPAKYTYDELKNLGTAFWVITFYQRRFKGHAIDNEINWVKAKSGEDSGTGIMRSDKLRPSIQH